MKHMNVKKKLMPMNIQFFAESSEGLEGGKDSKGAGGDDPDGDEPDEGGEEDSEEKKYTQKDMDDAVEKRLAREKRKWQRQQSQKPKSKPDNKPKESDNDDDIEASEKIRKAEEKAAELELRWSCLEHDVKKDCVDDVLALAKVHIAKDSDMDIEDAIDKVLEKYPHFKDGNTSEDDEDETDKKGWGQRHGKPPKKSATVDDEIRKQLFGK